MSEKHPRKSARAMLNKAGYSKLGGHMKGHADEAEDKVLIKRMVKKPALKLKSGGVAEGDESKPRADRLARGGKPKHAKGKAHTQVNVIVGGGRPKPVPVPVPKPVPVPVDPNAMAGAGAMPPPGAGAGPMPPSGAPMGLKRGGRAAGGDCDSQRDSIRGIADGQFKKGGRTKEKFPVPMEFGAGGGKGRLEKIKDYG